MRRGVGAVRGAFGCGFGQVVVSVSAEVTAASKVAQEPLALPCALGDLSHPSPGTHLPLGARGLQIWGNQAAPEPGRTLSRPRRALDPGTCHPGRGQSCPRCVLGWPGQSSAGGQGARPEGPLQPTRGSLPGFLPCVPPGAPALALGQAWASGAAARAWACRVSRPLWPQLSPRGIAEPWASCGVALGKNSV